WNDRGSPTAVTWAMRGDGFVGYAPDPKFEFTVTTLTRLVRLNPSTRASSFTPCPSAKARLTRRLRLKKSGPVPVFRPMNSPSTTGRPAVPAIVVTPDVMFNGRAEYARTTPLNWNPWLRCSHAEVAGPAGEFTEPNTTRRWRWSSSER